MRIKRFIAGALALLMLCTQAGAATVPYVFKNRSGGIPLSDLDADFAAFQDTSSDQRGAALVGFKNRGTGAIARTVDAELKDLYVNVRDFGAVCDGTYAGTGTDDSDAFLAAIASVTSPNANAGKQIFVPFVPPFGICKVTKPFPTLPAFGGGITMSPGASFWYTDTASPGSYLLNLGLPGERWYGGVFENLNIALRTVTAKGVRLLNSVSATFNNTYIQGYIPSNWPIGMNSRSNVGIALVASGADSFWNRFNGLWLNHLHTGFQCENGDAITQNFLTNVQLYGDYNYGDLSSVGLYLANCQDSIIQSGYVEAYATGSGAGMAFVGSRANRIAVQNFAFDNAPGLNMTAITFANDGSGTPSQIMVTDSTWPSSVTVNTSSQSTADRNYVGNMRTQPGMPWAPLLAPQTSGSITLNNGEGGNVGYALIRGNEARVWGTLTVSSAASPIGRLQITGLPYTSMNNDANYSPCAVWADGLATSSAGVLQAYVNRNSTVIDVSLFSGGVASTSTAQQFKAGSSLMFRCEYITAPL